MLARAACRVLSLFCAMLYLVVGVHGVKPKQSDGSERRRITDALLSTVAKGYPQAVHAIRVQGGGGCGKKKMTVPGPSRVFWGS
jgi:hypothetical protein